MSFCLWQVSSLIIFTPGLGLSAETPALPSLLIKDLLGAAVYALIKSVCLLSRIFRSCLFSKLSQFRMPFLSWPKQSSTPIFWKSLRAVYTGENEGTWILSSLICIYCCHCYLLFVRRTDTSLCQDHEWNMLWVRNINPGLKPSQLWLLTFCHRVLSPCLEGVERWNST